jgi:hypothetical protein
MQSLEEGRKKKFVDRERKTVVDPDTGEERKESYYEMMMRLKGKGSGIRSRATRQHKEKKSEKVKLTGRTFKPSEKAYETRLKGIQNNIINFVETTPASGKDIINFAAEYIDKDLAKKVVEDMVVSGLLDEVFPEGEGPSPEQEKAVDIEPTAMIDTEYDEFGDETELEDY